MLRGSNPESKEIAASNTAMKRPRKSSGVEAPMKNIVKYVENFALQGERGQVGKT